MARRKDKLSLGAFLLFTGHHVAAWRSKDASDSQTLQDFVQFARLAEDAKFDAVFLADQVGVKIDRLNAASRKAHTGVYPFEPLTLLSALSAVTSRIGLVATVSTSYNEPFNVARQFASLDRLSGGRAGWNLVTSTDASAALNFNHDGLIPHADRYARAEEFADVVNGLWDSWEEGAFLRDRADGRYFDPAKLHVLDHRGRHFKVRGPLNIPPAPQGRPVYVQAGSSEDGRAFAARFAEAIFTAHQTLASAQEFYADIKRQARALDRNPDHVKILPGISPFIGSTQAEADRLQEEFNDLIQPEYSLVQLRQMLGLDLSGFDLDGPFPRHLIETDGARGVASRFKLVVDIVDREKPTIRQLIQRLAGARGHWVIAGPPEKIADNIQTWFENGAADGFNVMPPWLPGGFDLFAEHVVPILRKRGLFREEYSGKTLREHYGLERPASLYSHQVQAIA
ncbi:LLM class flavin-dependent oxidoreductase [Bradyrhizobium sp.]|uniref:LLM class flavin-dependent oxidoreductase n=1 Tax=Bradyrhizobium sp. TaxID=376 RepID=UPI0028FFEF30|nr:LLM class flavin-dependent oxidoreductase [Bradyrhizobium sp.]MDU3044434.1 LLM class flavin-dependent oxidoreductase [Bradyrhizobium sp.]MDU6726468.1 LLM class flavin-dependent oxidoreductase [Bradyrhizobium sp.]